MRLSGRSRHSVERNRHAPVEVPGDRPRLQVVEQVAGELQHVRPPAVPGVQPLRQRLGECREVEEEVLGLDELRHLAVDLRPRVDQLLRVELVAAVVALVATRVGVPADRAGAFDVAVGQRPAGGRGDRPERGLTDDVAVVVQAGEQFLGRRVVVARGGPGEQVVRQAEAGRSSTITRLYRSASSRGVTPSASACTWIGVPCSSVPETMSTLWPVIRMYRLKTSEGTPKPET